MKSHFLQGLFRAAELSPFHSPRLILEHLIVPQDLQCKNVCIFHISQALTIVEHVQQVCYQMLGVMVHRLLTVHKVIKVSCVLID